MALQDIETVGQHSLQMEDDAEGFRKGLWPQRIGRLLMFLSLLAAAGGLFGTGPLSITTGKAGTVEIRYEKFLRFENETALELKLEQASGTTTVIFPNDYISSLRVARIQPQPESTAIIDNHVVYTFNQTDKGEIMFFISPEKSGSVKGSVKVNDQLIPLSHFIYP